MIEFECAGCGDHVGKAARRWRLTQINENNKKVGTEIRFCSVGCVATWAAGASNRQLLPECRYPASCGGPFRQPVCPPCIAWAEENIWQGGFA